MIAIRFILSSLCWAAKEAEGKLGLQPVEHTLRAKISESIKLHPETLNIHFLKHPSVYHPRAQWNDCLTSPVNTRSTPSPTPKQSGLHPNSKAAFAPRKPLERLLPLVIHYPRQLLVPSLFFSQPEALFQLISVS